MYVPFHFPTTTFRPMVTQDTMIHKQDYVDLGLSCADVCQTLERGLKGRRPNELSQSVLGAVENLTT